MKLKQDTYPLPKIKQHTVYFTRKIRFALSFQKFIYMCHGSQINSKPAGR